MAAVAANFGVAANAAAAKEAEDEGGASPDPLLELRATAMVAAARAFGHLAPSGPPFRPPPF